MRITSARLARTSAVLPTVVTKLSCGISCESPRPQRSRRGNAPDASDAARGCAVRERADQLALAESDLAGPLRGGDEDHERVAIGAHRAGAHRILAEDGRRGRVPHAHRVGTGDVALDPESPQGALDRARDRSHPTSPRRTGTSVARSRRTSGRAVVMAAVSSV